MPVTGSIGTTEFNVLVLPWTTRVRTDFEERVISAKSAFVEEFISQASVCRGWIIRINGLRLEYNRANRCFLKQ